MCFDNRFSEFLWFLKVYTYIKYHIIIDNSKLLNRSTAAHIQKVDFKFFRY
jgi:hypothetical protein